jgi:hypothetical protein
VKKLAVGAIAFTLLSFGSVATVAGFTDSATSTVTAKAGTVSLTVNNAATTSISFGTTLKPDGVAGAAQTITVKNAGTLALNFDIQSATTPVPGKLAEILDVTVTAGANTPVTTKLKSINTPSYNLAAGASMTVSFVPKWTSTAADDTYQGADGATTLTFSATQA